MMTALYEAFRDGLFGAIKEGLGLSKLRTIATGGELGLPYVVTSKAYLPQRSASACVTSAV